MKAIKVSEATNNQLNWLVAKCEGKIAFERNGAVRCRSDYGAVDYWFAPATTWSEMGPIIDREWIAVGRDAGDAQWVSGIPKNDPSKLSFGPTPLVAAARCYVASKLGDVVQVPEKLTQ